MSPTWLKRSKHTKSLGDLFKHRQGSNGHGEKDGGGGDDAEWHFIDVVGDLGGYIDDVTLPLISIQPLDIPNFSGITDTIDDIETYPVIHPVIINVQPNIPFQSESPPPRVITFNPPLPTVPHIVTPPSIDWSREIAQLQAETNSRQSLVALALLQELTARKGDVRDEREREREREREKQGKQMNLPMARYLSQNRPVSPSSTPPSSFDSNTSTSDSASIIHRSTRYSRSSSTTPPPSTTTTATATSTNTSSTVPAARFTGRTPCPKQRQVFKTPAMQMGVRRRVDISDEDDEEVLTDGESTSEEVLMESGSESEDASTDDESERDGKHRGWDDEITAQQTFGGPRICYTKRRVSITGVCITTLLPNQHASSSAPSLLLTTLPLNIKKRSPVKDVCLPPGVNRAQQNKGASMISELRYVPSTNSLRYVPSTEKPRDFPNWRTHSRFWSNEGGGK